MTGIVETKEALGFILTFGNAVGKSLEDGRMGITDLSHFVGLIATLPPAMNDAGKIPSELKDLDAAEKAELLDYAVEVFDLPQDGIEAKVEKYLKLAVDLGELFMEFKK